MLRWASHGSHGSHGPENTCKVPTSVESWICQTDMPKPAKLPSDRIDRLGPVFFGLPHLPPLAYQEMS